jgi:exodeoxyribonuclease VII small subunit
MEKKVKISFEEALSQLEEIVRRMEDGKLTLEETSRLYGEGVKLAALCKSKLNLTRKKVTLLSEEDGAMKEVVFDDADE